MPAEALDPPLERVRLLQLHARDVRQMHIVAGEGVLEGVAHGCELTLQHRHLAASEAGHGGGCRAEGLLHAAVQPLEVARELVDHRRDCPRLVHLGHIALGAEEVLEAVQARLQIVHALGVGGGPGGELVALRVDLHLLLGVVDSLLMLRAAHLADHGADHIQRLPRKHSDVRRRFFQVIAHFPRLVLLLLYQLLPSISLQPCQPLAHALINLVFILPVLYADLVLLHLQLLFRSVYRVPQILDLSQSCALDGTQRLFQRVLGVGERCQPLRLPARRPRCLSIEGVLHGGGPRAESPLQRVHLPCQIAPGDAECVFELRELVSHTRVPLALLDLSGSHLVLDLRLVPLHLAG
mmetsp:Transcript_40510/g.95141  ORF Transcript_40510/g.95141 Transcript_40510/m.95141 type:complete len:352 (+) Transcript_40510:736-1791(+)